MEFKKEYVHYCADKELVGKKVFVADSICALRDIVAHEYQSYYGVIDSVKESADMPFADEEGSEWKFAYYDPAYKATEGLQWTDLKIGDIISDSEEGVTAMVTAIDSEDDTVHICVGYRWLDDANLAEWKKV